MKIESWISYRYLIASKGRFLTFLNIISIVGVAIGVMALIVVIGIMTGFGNNLREKIIGTTPHLTIEKEIGIKDYTDLRKEMMAIAGVKGAAPYVQSNVFIETAGQAKALGLRGIDPVFEKEVTKVEEYLKEGDLADLVGNHVFIGRELARFFGLRRGDEVTIISPGSGVSGKDWRYQLIVAGIFSTGMADLDANLIFVNIKKAQEILLIPQNISSGLGIRLDEPNDANAIKEVVYQKIGYGFIVRSWADINKNLFAALRLEKWGLFIILSLMVLVASFNIISTLVVTVASKIHDIGILQSIGVSKRSIRKIFIYQGVFIGLMGTLMGLIGGIGTSYLLKTYFKVPEDIYYIDRVPIEMQGSDIAAIVIAAFVICFFATIYPSAKAAKLEPVEALRYE